MEPIYLFANNHLGGHQDLVMAHFIIKYYLKVKQHRVFHIHGIVPFIGHFKI